MGASKTRRRQKIKVSLTGFRHNSMKAFRVCGLCGFRPGKVPVETSGCQTRAKGGGVSRRWNWRSDDTSDDDCLRECRLAAPILPRAMLLSLRRRQTRLAQQV